MWLGIGRVAGCRGHGGQPSVSVSLLESYSAELSPLEWLILHDSVCAAFSRSLSLCLLQVMETKNMIYIVSEYASQGEIFGECTACGGEEPWET